MTQPAVKVNDAERFLSAFSGNIFIRLLHDDYNPNTKEPRRLRPRQVYGDLPTVLRWLETVATPLNSGATDEHKFQVFYCANDPQQGKHAQQGDIGALRVIYQDCDSPETALIEPEIANQQAHSVIESSPGKRQRIWHIEAGVDPFRHRAIHDHMCATRYHDPSTHGPHRLLRLPGFRNWKYDDGPVASLLSQRELPRLTVDQVFKAFGFKYADEHRDNINAAAQAIEQSGDLPQHKVYNLERERAKRQGVKDTDADTDARRRDASGLVPGEMEIGDLLNALAMLHPDSHRNDWRKIIAAIQFMAGEREWGRAVAEGWSSMGAKYDERAFEKEWQGLSRAVYNPASWSTLKRMTNNKRYTDEIRVLRECAVFKRLEEQFGPIIEYDVQFVEYIETRSIERNGIYINEPDPTSRKNIEQLLRLEGLYVYHDKFKQADMVQEVNGSGFDIYEFDERTLKRLQSTATSETHRLKAPRPFIAEMVELIALDNERDPVQEFLGSLPPWDGVERMSTAFQRLMGAEDRPSIREVLPLMMKAIIRRTKKPGYKFDLMPILEGKQGRGKSSFFRILMPNEEWFGEGPKMNEEPKRLLSQIGGKMVIEFGELVGMSKQNIDGVKKLITQQVDEYVANYARKKTRAPRRCVFVGSVDKTQYLRDLSDNRRFPIVPITKELEYGKLEAEREQLWAEAVFEEELTEHESLRLSPEAEDDMRKLQEDRLDINSETSAVIAETERFPDGYMLVETIWERLGIAFHKRKERTGHSQFLFKEIRDLMERNGWTWNGVIKVKGEPIRAIYRKRKRGEVREIICNGGNLCYADDAKPEKMTIEEMLK